jgi:4Fe-4S binding protein/cobalt chelatase family protein
MSAPFRNPAVEWFVSWFGGQVVIGQVLVCRRDKGYELRHAEDHESATRELRQATPEEARAIAQFTEGGAFRPLKSAPTLRRGWRILANSDTELATALDRLYPGVIADLYATLQRPAPVTDYRAFTSRQTGMYRITTFLDDVDAGAVVRKCCASQFCLKRRFWDVSGLAPEVVTDKSVIPCLEPCAVLLEFARKVVRATQQENLPVSDVLSKLDPVSKDEEAGRE